MATIIRNGQQIELTAEEIQQIRDEEHRNEHRYNIEEAVKFAEEEGQISFGSWADKGFAEYSSEEDAREDFIECILEHILDDEDIFSERAPIGYRYSVDYGAEVLDTAEDLEYLTEN